MHEPVSKTHFTIIVSPHALWAPVGASFPKSCVEILLLAVSEKEVVYWAPAYGGVTAPLCSDGLLTLAFIKAVAVAAEA
jgi:hypothetical protein